MPESKIVNASKKISKSIFQLWKSYPQNNCIRQTILLLKMVSYNNDGHNNNSFNNNSYNTDGYNNASHNSNSFSNNTSHNNELW